MPEPIINLPQECIAKGDWLRPITCGIYCYQLICNINVLINKINRRKNYYYYSNVSINSIDWQRHYTEELKHIKEKNAEDYLNSIIFKSYTPLQVTEGKKQTIEPEDFIVVSITKVMLESDYYDGLDYNEDDCITDENGNDWIMVNLSALFAYNNRVMDFNKQWEDIAIREDDVSYYIEVSDPKVYSFKRNAFIPLEIH